MSDKPPDLSSARLDFSQFHATGDHWPFTAYCRSQYKGGWHHLSLAWEYRRRDQVLKPWHWLTCKLGHHHMWSGHTRVGLGPDDWVSFTDCRYCGMPA